MSSQTNQNQVIQDQATITKQWLKRIPVTVWLVVAILVMYCYTALISGNFLIISVEVLEFLGASQVAFSQWRYWNLVTSIFTHQGILHLSLNLFSLTVIGIVFEKEGGRKNFLIIFFLTGIFTLTLSVIIFPTLVFVGTSAAIYGIAGATIMRQLKSVLFGTLFILALFMFTPPLSFLGHGIGAFVGVVADQVMLRRNNLKNSIKIHATKIT